jgi:hypothetical protein
MSKQPRVGLETLGKNLLRKYAKQVISFAKMVPMGHESDNILVKEEAKRQSR